MGGGAGQRRHCNLGLEGHRTNVLDETTSTRGLKRRTLSTLEHRTNNRWNMQTARMYVHITFAPILQVFTQPSKIHKFTPSRRGSTLRQSNAPRDTPQHCPMHRGAMSATQHRAAAAHTACALVTSDAGLSRETHKASARPHHTGPLPVRIFASHPGATSSLQARRPTVQSRTPACAETRPDDASIQHVGDDESRRGRWGWRYGIAGVPSAGHDQNAAAAPARRWGEPTFARQKSHNVTHGNPLRYSVHWVPFLSLEKSLSMKASFRCTKGLVWWCWGSCPKWQFDSQPSSC